MEAALGQEQPHSKPQNFNKSPGCIQDFTLDRQTDRQR